jgi:hypothetical protein
MVGFPSIWIVNSEATDHICNSLQGLIKKFSKREHALQVGYGTNIWEEAVKEIILYFDLDRILVLKDVLFVPVLKQIETNSRQPTEQHNLVNYCHGFFLFKKKSKYTIVNSDFNHYYLLHLFV